MLAAPSLPKASLIGSSCSLSTHGGNINRCSTDDKFYSLLQQPWLCYIYYFFYRSLTLLAFLRWRELHWEAPNPSQKCLAEEASDEEQCWIPRVCCSYLNYWMWCLQDVDITINFNQVSRQLTIDTYVGCSKSLLPWRLLHLWEEMRRLNMTYAAC